MAELVTDYLEGALPLMTRLNVRWHLFQCTACVHYFDQFRRTIGLLADAPPPEPPPDTVADHVITRLRATARPQAGDD